jgi:hypothetical protein
MLKELLLKEVGQRLARQPFQGFFWQQGAKYIQVSPVISEAYPLWKIENQVLENELSLFGVKPQQLEQQISDYRQKAWIVRWLLRLFSRINTKIAVWSYYRQCLSFRALSQREALSSPQKSDFPVDFTITQALLPYLRKDIYQFEKMIDRHLRSVEASEDKFLLRYQAYAEKQEARFLKLLEKQLKDLSREQQTLLRDTLKEEYRGMRKMMKKFTESCLKGVKQVKEQLSPFMPNLTLPLVKSEILYAEDDRPSNNISPLASNPSVAQMPVNNRLEETITKIEVLVKQQRQEMKCLLAREDSSDKEIESFLKNSFHEIRHIIKSRLAEHQALVDALRSGRLNYRQARQQSEALQEKLAPFFKKKVFLLFHPDKYDSANGPIKQILDALFIQIKNLYETSVAQLLEGIEIIQQANDEKEDHDQILQAYRELYRVFLKDFTAVYEKYEQKVTAMYKEMEVQMKEHHAEVQMYHAEVQMHYAKAEAKMQEWERQFRARMALPQNQATASDASDNETAAATGYSFFPAGR